MRFKLVKPCSGDVYEAVPTLNMDISLDASAGFLEMKGWTVVANAQRFLIVDSPNGIRFELHGTGRLEVRTPSEEDASRIAEEVYNLLEDMR